MPGCDPGRAGDRGAQLPVLLHGDEAGQLVAELRLEVGERLHLRGHVRPHADGLRRARAGGDPAAVLGLGGAPSAGWPAAPAPKIGNLPDPPQPMSSVGRPTSSAIRNGSSPVGRRGSPSCGRSAWSSPWRTSRTARAWQRSATGAARPLTSARSASCSRLGISGGSPSSSTAAGALLIPLFGLTSRQVDRRRAGLAAEQGTDPGDLLERERGLAAGIGLGCSLGVHHRLLAAATRVTRASSNAGSQSATPGRRAHEQHAPLPGVRVVASPPKSTPPTGRRGCRL